MIYDVISFDLHLFAHSTVHRLNAGVKGGVVGEMEELRRGRRKDWERGRRGRIRDVEGGREEQILG